MTSRRSQRRLWPSRPTGAGNPGWRAITDAGLWVTPRHGDLGDANRLRHLPGQLRHVGQFVPIVPLGEPDRQVGLRHGTPKYVARTTAASAHWGSPFPAEGPIWLGRSSPMRICRFHPESAERTGIHSRTSAKLVLRMKFILSPCPIHQECTIHVVFGKTSERRAPWPDPDLKPIAEREFPGLVLIEAEHLRRRSGAVVSQTSRQPALWGAGYFRSISARRPSTTTRAALSSSKSISSSPKVRVSG